MHCARLQYDVCHQGAMHCALVAYIKQNSTLTPVSEELACTSNISPDTIKTH